VAAVALEQELGSSEVARSESAKRVVVEAHMDTLSLAEVRVEPLEADS